MNGLAKLALALAVLGGITLASATGAFTAAEVDRPMSISTVENEDGLVGLSADPIDAGSNTTTTLFEVENRFVDDLDVSVSGVDDGDGALSVTVDEEPTDLSIGESDSVVGTVACPGSVDRDVTFSVTASGDGGTFDGTITVPVSCTPDESDVDAADVTFRGCNAAEVTGFDGSMNVTVLTYNQGQGVVESPKTVETGDKIGSKGGGLIGLDAPFGTVSNPNFDFDEGKCGDQSGEVPGEQGDPRERLED